MHCETHRPSPPNAVHFFGVKTPPVLMNSSGTQELLPSHLSRMDWSCEGMVDVVTQCAVPGKSVQHEGSEAGLRGLPSGPSHAPSGGLNTASFPPCGSVPPSGSN